LACLAVHWAASGEDVWQKQKLFQTLSEDLLLIAVTMTGRSLKASEASLEESRGRLLELHQQLLSHLEKARQVQVELLGVPPVSIEGFDLSVLYEVAVELGGDLFFVKELPNGLFFSVGDVSGRGPEAAIAAACVRVLLEELVNERISPGELLFRLQQRFSRLLPGDLFVTSFCADCDPQDNTLVYANAGHDPPLLIRLRHEAVEELAGGSLPLGVDVDERFPEHRLNFEPGDRLLVFTDGLIDARQNNGERLGSQVVERLVMDSQGNSQHLASQLMELAPEPRSDDVLVLFLTRQ